MDKIRYRHQKSFYNLSKTLRNFKSSYLLWLHYGRPSRIASHKGRKSVRKSEKYVCWWCWVLAKLKGIIVDFFFFGYSINLFYYFLEKIISFFKKNLRNSINTKIKSFLRHIRTLCDPIDNKIILNKSKSYKAEINKIKITQLNWILDIIKECNL